MSVINLNNADSIYFGSRKVDRIYAGAQRVWPGWSPAELFANGEQGALYYFTPDFAGLYQDAAGTTPVTAVGQPVGLMLDRSGNGNHASQTTTTARPTLQRDVNGKLHLLGDGVDDFMTFPVVAIGKVRTLAAAYEDIASSGTVGIIGSDIGTSGLLRAGGTLRMYPGGANTGITGLDAPRTVVGWLDGVDSYCSIQPDGVEVSLPSTLPSAGIAQLFHYSTGATCANGRLWGAVIVDRTTTGVERHSLHAFLASQAGITLPEGAPA